MYHRVAESEADPLFLSVSPEHFYEHMDALRRVGRPFALGDLVRAHAADNIPENAVTVTFDDGYLDNLTNAKPILEAHDIPATVFVCSGAVGRNEEFWWDQLTHAFLGRINRLPTQLVVDAAGKRFSWNFEDAYRAEKNGASSNVESTDAIALSNCTAVRKVLRTLPAEMQQQWMRQIREWASIPDEARPTHRSLNEGQLAALAAGGLVDIGAHTVTHPLLPAQPCELQREEIINSRSQLEKIIQRPVEHFAYPYGEYDQTTVKILHEAGFASACTTVDRAMTRRTKTYEIPRVPVQNWSGEKFLEIVQRKLSDSDVMSRDCEIGDEIVFPLNIFMTKTGELEAGALQCIPKKHAPGHCLYGPGYVISASGTYRAVFAVVQEHPEVTDDMVFDVYENRRTNRVLAEAHLAPNRRCQTVVLEFFAKEGYAVELRVYWRGRSRVKVTTISLQRLG
jgi:peptidoglycan/xylan/chitin deacetylase (PgdA/CDA1 family)